MFILTKKKFHFSLGGEHFTTKGGMEMESAPDWITSCPLYDWAVEDGDIIVAQDSSDKAATVAVAKSKSRAKSTKAKKVEAEKGDAEKEETEATEEVKETEE